MRDRHDARCVVNPCSFAPAPVLLMVLSEAERRLLRCAPALAPSGHALTHKASVATVERGARFVVFTVLAEGGGVAGDVRRFYPRRSCESLRLRGVA